ncbi:hypothetical protein CRE_23491 [Caenorhabditis remanei]|uniref:DUF281 domain-containing protein n=1 Tax=Caenorhabditis remanei TaxID=31234 RepID=E3MH03_CAERE|nr:hypothetical protein CRE_23491 [Caenorhabditis remanei]
MIPPEEVSISSTPAATVPTHEPSRPPPEVSTEATTVQTEAPATNEPPVTMAPPVTEAPVTVTPTDPCTTCNIAEISVTPPDTGIALETQQIVGTDGCNQATVTCRRTDGTGCNYIPATTPEGTASISSTSDSSSENDAAETTAGPVPELILETTNSFFVGAIVECANDGTWYSDTV